MRQSTGKLNVCRPSRTLLVCQKSLLSSACFSTLTNSHRLHTLENSCCPCQVNACIELWLSNFVQIGLTFCNVLQRLSVRIHTMCHAFHATPPMDRKKRKEKKRKEKKRKEKTTPFGVNLMRSQVLYRAAQTSHGHSPFSFPCLMCP